MALANVSKAILHPKVCIKFQIERQYGEFNSLGIFNIASIQILGRWGSIQPANEADKINFLPEGQRADNAIKIYSTQSLLMGDGDAALPDIILYKEGRYKLIASKDYSDFGYWFAIAEKM